MGWKSQSLTEKLAALRSDENEGVVSAIWLLDSQRRTAVAAAQLRRCNAHRNKNYFIAYLEGGEAMPEETVDVCERAGRRVGYSLPRLPRSRDEEVRKTFYSFQSANQWAQNYFLNEENSDETRAAIIEINRRQWQSIRTQVREWFKEN